jgi:hypothetical protein
LEKPEPGESKPRAKAGTKPARPGFLELSSYFTEDFCMARYKGAWLGLVHRPA